MLALWLATIAVTTAYHSNNMNAAVKKCVTAMDRSLGGQCDEGRCRCWPMWKGQNCSVLNLLPATAVGDARLPAAWARPGNQSSWGGRPIYDHDSGRWHLFAADMSGHCGLDAWRRNSI